MTFARPGLRPSISQLIKKCSQEAVNDNNPILVDKLYTDFINNTTYSHNNTSIEIGKLMDKYDIESHELLCAIYNIMYADVVCSYSDKLMSKLEQDPHSINLSMDDAKHILKQSNHCIEYLYGKPIKMFFRRNRGEDQYVLLKKSDSRLQVSDDKFYQAIMWLIIQKLKSH